MSKQKEIPEKYRILSIEGYWNRVLEIRQSNNLLTIPNLWEIIEDELSEFGIHRYSTWGAFKDAYYKNINKKNKR